MLVLSLFPGIGLLDRAFELEGFVVVRGPDVLWGGDIREFHPPAGKFDGIIGGPPCPKFSTLAALNPHAASHDDLIPEFRRVVEEAEPTWFLMENVRGAYSPAPSGYEVTETLLNNRWFGADQNRVRKFWFGTRDGSRLDVQQAPLESPRWEHAVLAGHGAALGQRVNGMVARGWRDMARLQGLPESFDLPGLTTHGKRKAIGNGVPLPMGRAVARAVRAAVGSPAVSAEADSTSGPTGDKP